MQQTTIQFWRDPAGSEVDWEGFRGVLEEPLCVGL